MTTRTRSAFAAPTGFVATVTRQKPAVAPAATASVAPVFATISHLPAARPDIVAVQERQAA